MDKRKQFQYIDLTIFSILAMLSEYFGYRLLEVFEYAGFVFSFSLLLGLIAIYRWGLSGAIVFIVSGIPMIFINSNYGVNVLFYPVANCMILIIPFLLRFVDKEQIKYSLLRSFGYVFLSVLFVSIGKGLVILIVEGHAYGFVDYFASQLLTIVITFIVLNIVSHVEGLLVDMTTYIQD